MARVVRTVLSLIVVLALTSSAWAQTVTLQGRTARGTISANGGSVTLFLQPGETMGSAMLQTLDSYSGTIEVRCSADGVVFDADNEPLVNLVGATSTASSITDTVGLWNINGVAGCRALQVIATAGFAASNTTLVITAIPAGGGSGGGGGGAIAGDASATKQDEQTALLTTIDGDTGTIAGAFGTAGTADAQVLSVQGIASMTPISVQSGGADLATAATQDNIDSSLNDIETAVEELADAISSNRVNTNIETIGGVAPTPDRTFDGDSGGGTVTTSLIGLGVAASGGPIALEGTAANGLEVDVTRLSALVAGDADIGNVDLEVSGVTIASNIGSPTPQTLRVVQASSPNIFRSLDLDESEEEADDDSGEVCSIIVTNTATATRWLKIYNADADDVTVGSTTPVLTIGIPGNASDDISAALPIGGNGCYAYTTALTLAATTGFADADTGAPGANEVIINVFYR